MIRIEDYFANYPSQMKVVEIMMRYGISVRDENAYAGTVKLTDAALSVAAGVDRRVVRSTIDRISLVPELSALFSKIGCMAVLDKAASLIGCSSIEIVPDDDSRPGTLAGIMNILSDAGINVKQAVVRGEKDEKVSHLVIVVVGTIPGDVLASIRDSPGVSKVIL